MGIFKPNIEKMKANGDVEGLIKALKHRDEAVQEDAAVALGRIGDVRAVDPLIRALKDELSDVRERAAYALGKIGDARAVDPLIRALKGEYRSEPELSDIHSFVLALKKITGISEDEEMVTYINKIRKKHEKKEQESTSPERSIER